MSGGRVLGKTKRKNPRKIPWGENYVSGGKNNYKTVKDKLPDYEIFLTKNCYNEINSKNNIDL